MASTMKNPGYRCGDLRVRDTGETARVFDGETASRERSSGVQRLFELEGPGRLRVKVALTEWRNGEADVRAVEVQGPQAVRRLERGSLRLGIRPTDDDPDRVWLELRQARVKLDTQNHWSNLFQANPLELDRGAGVPVFDLLREHGAVELGTKEDLLGCDDRTRWRLCAVFPKENVLGPVVAFAATRVLPLKNLYPA